MGMKRLKNAILAGHIMRLRSHWTEWAATQNVLPAVATGQKVGKIRVSVQKLLDRDAVFRAFDLATQVLSENVDRDFFACANCAWRMQLGGLLHLRGHRLSLCKIGELSFFLGELCQ